jgi:hypothetical protein
MRHLLWLVALLPPLFALPAFGADFIEGIYSTPEGCTARKEGAEGDGDHLYLSARGLEGIEFTCEFVNVTGRSELPGWVAVAFCEEPGLAFPELFSLMPRTENTLELSLPSLAAAPQGGPGVQGEYVRCED